MRRRDERLKFEDRGLMAVEDADRESERRRKTTTCKRTSLTTINLQSKGSSGWDSFRGWTQSS
jgi:hypothetical protein